MYNDELPEIVELEMMLQQNREEAGLDRDRVIARTASVNKEKRMERLLKEGHDIRTVGDALQIPYVVVARTARRLEQERATSDIDIISPPGEGGYFAILPK
ncbi:MAG TPA: hypothetical protein VKA95_02950 [Nitrososphaeraceae archaeon]|nr:hypothetical protein [Nitrososphaeraceae archaeon]